MWDDKHEERVDMYLFQVFYMMSIDGHNSHRLLKFQNISIYISKFSDISISDIT